MREQFVRLRERYFPSDDEIALQEREAEQERGMLRGKILGFVTQDYFQEFMRWLEEEKERVSPQVGDHTNMLYQTGQRDGVKLVVAHLREMIDFCEEE